jgi:GNAT superfamily N-acetyltransferase
MDSKDIFLSHQGQTSPFPFLIEVERAEGVFIFDKQGKKYGSTLLDFFEKHVKNLGIKWIFLNATSNSLEFYKKHNFDTSIFSTVLYNFTHF